MAIDYQVGDIVKTRFWVENTETPEILCEVVTITEKGVYLRAVGYDSRIFLVGTHEMHLLIKDKTGTILYGNKKIQHS